MPKNQDIEGLRAYAILITLVAHAGELVPSWIPWLAYFWLGGGVDLFFCISGFVITRSLVNQAHRSQSSSFASFAVPFWLRRVFRLWPAALFWSAFSVACAYTFNNSGAFGAPKDISATAVAALVQLVNLRLTLCLNQIFGTCATPDALWHYWSLSLEEQFYVIYPLLFFFIPRTFFVFLIASAILLQFPLERTFPSVFWFYRTDAILFGILIAFFEPMPLFGQIRKCMTGRPKLTRTLCALISVLLIVMARPQVAFFYHGLMAVLAGCFVLIASFDRDLVVPFPSWRPVLAFVGSRSYSIYLIHMPVFRLAREVAFRLWGTGEQSLAKSAFVIVLAIICTAVASEASYRVIENPLRRLGRRLGTRSEVEVPYSPGLVWPRR